MLKSLGKVFLWLMCFSFASRLAVMFGFPAVLMLAAVIAASFAGWPYLKIWWRSLMPIQSQPHSSTSMDNEPRPISERLLIALWVCIVAISAVLGAAGGFGFAVGALGTLGFAGCIIQYVAIGYASPARLFSRR